MKNVIGRVLIVIALMILGYLAIIILGVIIGVAIAAAKGPEALEYFKPQ